MSHFLRNNLLKIEKYPLLFLGIIWVIVQWTLFLQYGFNTEFEGLKYQDDAQLLGDSFQIKTSRLFYALYPLIIVFFIKINLGVKAVFIFQLLVNLVSTYFFYKLSMRWFSNIYWAIFTTILLLFTVQIQMWNYFLFTESLFISGLIIYTYILFFADLSRVISIFKLGILFIALSFLRPTGILLLVPTILYFIYNRNRIKTIVIYTGIVFGLLIVGFNVVFSTGQFQEYVSMAWSNGWVIWGYDGFENILLEEGGWKAIKLIYYRIFYYLSMIRPYYSDSHNIIMTAFYPVYILALLGMFSPVKKYRSEIYFVIAIIAVFSLFSIFTFINWHGRFIAPILPFIILIAGFGFQNLVQKLQK